MHPYHRNNIANTHHNRATWTGEVVGNRSVLILLNKFPRKQFDSFDFCLLEAKIWAKKIMKKLEKCRVYVHADIAERPNRLSGIIIIGLQGLI